MHYKDFATLLYHGITEADAFGSHFGGKAFAELTPSQQATWEIRAQGVLGVLQNKGDGFAIVPLKPTEAMEKAGWPHVETSWGPRLDVAYRAMIDAYEGDGPKQDSGVK